MIDIYITFKSYDNLCGLQKQVEPIVKFLSAYGFHVFCPIVSQYFVANGVDAKKEFTYWKAGNMEYMKSFKMVLAIENKGRIKNRYFGKEINFCSKNDIPVMFMPDHKGNLLLKIVGMITG